VVLPEELLEEKPRLHQDAMRTWAMDHRLDFLRAWAIREACIEALTAK
jgi:hypothetical protein